MISTCFVNHCLCFCLWVIILSDLITISLRFTRGIKFKFSLVGLNVFGLQTYRNSVGDILLCRLFQVLIHFASWNEEMIKCYLYWWKVRVQIVYNGYEWYTSQYFVFPYQRAECCFKKRGRIRSVSNFRGLTCFKQNIEMCTTRSHYKQFVHVLFININNTSW
jgi:hypothetical protein